MKKALSLFLFMVLGITAWEGKSLTVRSVQGKAWQIQGEQAKALKPGQKLRAGAQLVTGDASKIVLLFDDGTLASLGEKARVTLQIAQKDAQGQSRVLWGVQYGALSFKVKRLIGDSSYHRFETPTATAAIRGTEGAIETNGASTLAWLNEGEVELHGLNDSVRTQIKAQEWAIQTPKGFELKTKTRDQNWDQILREARQRLEDENQSILDPKQRQIWKTKRAEWLKVRDLSKLSPAQRRNLLERLRDR